MTYQAVIQAVNNKDIKPVYTVLGSERYLRDGFMTALEEALASKYDNYIETTRLDLKEVELLDVLAEADSFSFFSEIKLVIVDNVDFTKAGGTSLTKAEEGQLLAYLNNPNEATVLVWLIPDDNVDKRRKVTKALTNDTTLVKATPLDERDTVNYVREYLKEADLTLTKDALNELLNRTSYSLTTCMHEIDKLKIYPHNNQTIGVELIRELVPRDLESDVFELTNAITRRDLTKAVQIYQDLRLQRNEPTALHALLVSQFRLFIQCRYLAGSGLRQDEIAQTLKVHPYRVKLALDNTRRTDLDDLLDFYNALAEVDFKMKSSTIDADLYFYLLLIRYMQI